MGCLAPFDIKMQREVGNVDTKNATKSRNESEENLKTKIIEKETGLKRQASVWCRMKSPFTHSIVLTMYNRTINEFGFSLCPE